MIWWILGIIYIIGIFFSYFKYIKNWKNPTWEKICFSIIWPLVLPIYGIYRLHFKF